MCSKVHLLILKDLDFMSIYSQNQKGCSVALLSLRSSTASDVKTGAERLGTRLLSDPPHRRACGGARVEGPKSRLIYYSYCNYYQAYKNVVDVPNVNFC